MAGIAEAVKKDVTGNELGITYQPFRNIDKFIRENKLKLSPEEQARILDLMRNAAKKGLKDQDIVDLAHKEINNFVGDVGNIQPQPARPARSSTISTLEQNNVIPIVEQGINTIKTHGSKWIFSTPHILRKLPEAVKWARKTIDANLKSDFEIGRDRMYFEDVLTRLTEEQRGQIQKTYDKFVNLLAAKNKTTEQIVADRQKAAQWATVDPLAKASLDIATYYSEVRDAYIDSRVEMFKMKRGDEAKAALEVANLHDQSGSKNLELYILSPDGVTMENPAYFSIADKYHMSYNRLSKVTKEYYDVVNWGLEAYRTRIERGMFKITLKRGGDKHDRVLGFEQTRLDAVTRAKELQESGKLKGEEIVIQRVPWRKPDPTKPGKKSLRGMEMFEGLNTYSYIMRKKIHFDPLSYALRREFRNDPNSVKYADYVRSVLYDQLGDAKGTYSYGDKIVDSMIYWMQEKSPLKDSPLTNIPPGLYGRGVRYGRWAMSNVKLGYRPMAGALNLFWGTRNIYVKNGLNFVSQAAKFMKTTEGKRLIENNEWALGMDLARTEAGSTTALKPWEPVYWFSKPEPFIRKLALTTNYLYGKMKLGLGEAEAQAYAREGVRTQAWLYNNAALPKLFRGHTRKALFQFKSAMVHQYEFIRGLTPQQLVRFLATEAIISGPRGTLLFIKSLPFLAAFGIMDDIEEWLLKRKVPENVPLIGGQPYTFGVPGLAGIDVSQAATLQFLSQDLEDNFGPLLTTAIDAYKSTLGAAVKGYPMEVDPIVRTAPFLNNWMQFLDSVDPDNDGWVYSDQGKKYKVGSWYDRALLLSGATPMERTKQSVMLRVLRNEEDRINKQKREVYDRLVQLKPGEPITKSLLDKAVEYGITSEGLSRRLLLYNLDPKLRETLKADALRKMRVMGLYSEIE
jgi:hypothetical protein